MKVLKEAQAAFGKQPADLLFPDHDEDTIKKYFSNFFHQTAKVKVQSHDFRTSKITEMIEAGADLKVVQRYVGHKNAATTLGYHKLDVAEANKRAAELMFKEQRKVGVKQSGTQRKRELKKPLRASNM